MYVVPKVCRAVTLFGRDGSVWRFASLRRALSSLGISWIRRHVARNFREYDSGATTASRTPVYRESDFVMRDDFGVPLVAKDFAELVPRRRSPLDGPVPFLGNKWPASASHSRRPRTFGEYRDAAGMNEEGEPSGRPRRRHLHRYAFELGPWPVSRYEKNWKRHSKRHRQWRAKV